MGKLNLIDALTYLKCITFCIDIQSASLELITGLIIYRTKASAVSGRCGYALPL